MDEATLIAAARQGDTQSFDQLVRLYQGAIYNLAYRILGDVEAASDATQDAFLSAYRAIGRYRGGSFKGWLLRIVTNACYDQLRRKKRQPTTSLEAVYLDSEPPWAENEEPEEYALRQELGRIIQRGLATLPPEQRIALVLSDIQGLSYKEIAEVMGTNLGTVKSRLNRGRASLRDHLLAQGELLPPRYRLKIESHT
ncbi:MAG: sigma-70 family RNA polymerase sigma factor [Anaerolineae bacterium]|nr:sigma-70 family RNA polymerase sigma factor [Anaerolineae bacterium]